nr:hypothetical protein GCM10020185_10550 [Pseudomonas brassicacearum subsp. brassicacearum]
MEAPLPTANEAMAQLHDRFAGEYLARFFSESRVTHKARQVLCRLLPQGEPKRDVVAQTLHLSQRTLQRRLQEEGTSFQSLLEDTRRELAEQYLAQSGMTLLEIAYLLGFADPSNFFSGPSAAGSTPRLANTGHGWRASLKRSVTPERRDTQHEHRDDLQSAQQHAS